RSPVGFRSGTLWPPACETMLPSRRMSSTRSGRDSMSPSAGIRNCPRRPGPYPTRDSESLTRVIVGKRAIIRKMMVHLIDGTYELFRHFYGLKRFSKGKDRPYGAALGVLNTVLQ